MDEDEADLFEDHERILLLEDPRVYLLRNEESEPDLEEKLAHAFRKVWTMLPSTATKALCQHWQPNPRYAPERIVIKDLGWNSRGKRILGETQLSGQRIVIAP